jgi:hypothetical protein
MSTFHFDDAFREAINEWAKEQVFAATNWRPFQSKEGEKKAQADINRPKVIGRLNAGFKISPGQPINTSVFEEAIMG